LDKLAVVHKQSKKIDSECVRQAQLIQKLIQIKRAADDKEVSHCLEVPLENESYKKIQTRIYSFMIPVSKSLQFIHQDKLQACI
jgi:hypothetical protein